MIDNEASARYTVIEIAAANARGFVDRISGALSRCGCELDLVVISTEGAKAHDIFRVTRNKTKVPTADCPRVAHEVERACHF